MKRLRVVMFFGMLVILAGLVLSCAPKLPPTTNQTKGTVPTTQIDKGNWTYIPINRDTFDPAADLEVLSRWSDNNPRRELISFQFVSTSDRFGITTLGVFIYSRAARP